MAQQLSTRETVENFRIVKLIGKNDQARTVLQKYGSAGWVIRTSNASPRGKMRGTWYLVALGEPNARWIHAVQDPMFQVLDTDHRDMQQTA